MPGYPRSLPVRRRSGTCSPRCARRARAAVAWNAGIARLLVWLFNVEGTVDLMTAITLATIYGAAPFMGAAYWIPAFWVPALLVTHYLTFVVLLRHWPRAARPGVSPGRGS
jgi:hypothetical protein